MPLLNPPHMVDYSDSESDQGLPPVQRKEPRMHVTAKKPGAIVRLPDETIVVNGYTVENPTIALVTLARMPAINNVELRDETADLHFEKRYSPESYLIISRGVEQEHPCTRCQEGRGPYKKCIRVPDMCTGACGNCIYGSNMGRCSCREHLPAKSRNNQRERKLKVLEPITAPKSHNAHSRPKKRVKLSPVPDENRAPSKQHYELNEALADDEAILMDAPAPVLSEFPTEPRTELNVEGAIREAKGLGHDKLLQVRDVQALRLAILDREIAARRFADADNVLASYTKRG